jgi:hypothetical protein
MLNQEALGDNRSCPVAVMFLAAESVADDDAEALFDAASKLEPASLEGAHHFIARAELDVEELFVDIDALGSDEARQRLVESRKGAVALRQLPMAPSPFPAHQTGRADFPHPAFRLSSPKAHVGDRARPR